MSDVFISYSSRDRQIADRIAGDLTQLGLKVFYDKELLPGEAWRPRLANELKRAKYVLVLLSPAYVRSEWAERELEAAALSEAEGSTRIIPVLVEDTEIPPFLRSKYYADLRKDYQAGLELVRKAIVAQREPSEESRERGLRKAVDLLQVMVPLLGAAASVLASVVGREVPKVSPFILAVVTVTVAALTALVGIMSVYRPYRRSPPVELLVHGVQRAYLDALEGSALNPLRLGEVDRG